MGVSVPCLGHLVYRYTHPSLMTRPLYLHTVSHSNYIQSSLRNPNHLDMHRRENCILCHACVQIIQQND